MAVAKPWDQYPYKVFVSYAHDDVLPEQPGKTWGAWLEEEIEAYRVPRKLVGQWTPFGLVPPRIRPVFRDRSGFSADAKVADAINARLDDSATLIVICSLASARSRYVNDEIRRFKASGKGDRIFALIVDGEPGSGTERECFPEALRFDVSSAGDIRTSQPVEPLAADAREGKDGRRGAFLKIVAGLLGVSPTDLQEKTNEILEREARRARIVRNAILAVGTIAVIIAAFAFSQRNEALSTESKFLANQAIAVGAPDGNWAEGDALRAARIALEGAPSVQRAVLDRPDVPSTDGVLQGAGSLLERRLAATLTGHDGMVLSAAFSRDGTRIVTASHDKTARIWNAAVGKAIAILTGHEDTVRSAAFSPDGTRIVTASWDTTARIWNAANGKPVTTLTGHKHLVFSAAFSPDGTRIVTASWDKTALIWNAADGKPVVTLKGHDGVVYSAAYSPDGTRIVTASGDNTARIWNAADGKPVATLSGHEGMVLSAAFSPDGTRIVTASNDKTARIWRLSDFVLPETGHALATRVCAILARYGDVKLTPEDAARALRTADSPHPCRKYGLLHPQYYADAARDAWAWVQDRLGFTPSPKQR